MRRVADACSQLEGLNWLIAMHSRQQNGILADEMGLGAFARTPLRDSTASAARHDLNADSTIFTTAAACAFTAVICFLTPEPNKDNQALSSGTSAPKADDEAA